MNTVNENERKDIEELLPWHAAGTLSRRDAQRVEAALASDPELARRYALVREELGQTIHLNETLGAPSSRAMETLFAKIDAEPARTAGDGVRSRRPHRRILRQPDAAHAGVVGGGCRGRDPAAGGLHRRHGHQATKAPAATRPPRCPAPSKAKAPMR